METKGLKRACLHLFCSLYTVWLLPSLLFFMLLYLFSLSCSTVLADDSKEYLPSEGIFYDQYFSVYLSDALGRRIKCGWARFWSTRRADKIITSNMTHLTVGRAGYCITISTTSCSIETIDGKPLYCEFIQQLGDSRLKYISYFGGDLLRVKIERGLGGSSEYTFDLKGPVELSWASYLRLREYLLNRRLNGRENVSYTIKSYDPQLLLSAPIEIGITIGKEKSLRIVDRSIKGRELISTIKEPIFMESYALIDDSANPLYIRSSIGPISIEMIKDRKESAIADVEFFDILKEYAILPSAPFKLKDVMLYKITAKGNLSIGSGIPQTELQSIVRRSASEIIIKRIMCERRVEPKMAGAFSSDKAPLARYQDQHEKKDDYKRYLSGSSYIDLDDPRLAQLLDKASAGVNSPYKLAKVLCMFVREYITDKNLRNVFSSSYEVIRTRSGDCTEHSVLLIALLRKAKIPARAVVGLVYSDNPSGNPADSYAAGKGAFFYHMWVDAYIGGRWIELDPTLGQIVPDTAHIALKRLDLDDENNIVLDLADLLSFIGTVDIAVEH